MVESGYSGGIVQNPSYGQVCSGTTGHAEVVEVTFDPKVVSLKEILQIFFTIHDPTTMNRQGADVGAQYRSVIFYRNSEQKEIIEQVIDAITESRVWDKHIVTQVVPFEVFYKAEEYHQNYFKQNSNQPYCQLVIAPKVAKLRKNYYNKLKASEIMR